MWLLSAYTGQSINICTWTGVEAQRNGHFHPSKTLGSLTWLWPCHQHAFMLQTDLLLHSYTPFITQTPLWHTHSHCHLKLWCFFLFCFVSLCFSVAVLEHTASLWLKNDGNTDLVRSRMISLGSILEVINTYSRNAKF